MTNNYETMKAADDYGCDLDKRQREVCDLQDLARQIGYMAQASGCTPQVSAMSVRFTNQGADVSVTFKARRFISTR
jgi:hypothetical protein